MVPSGVVFVGELLLHESTSSTMPAWSLGSCARRRRRRRRHASFHPTLIFFVDPPSCSWRLQRQHGSLGSCVRDPATEQSTTSTTPACCAWSLGSCARSLAAAVVQRQHGSLGSCVRGGNCYCMSPCRLQRQHGPSGVVSVVVVMRRFTPR